MQYRVGGAVEGVVHDTASKAVAGGQLPVDTTGIVEGGGGDVGGGGGGLVEEGGGGGAADIDGEGGGGGGGGEVAATTVPGVQACNQ